MFLIRVKDSILSAAPKFVSAFVYKTSCLAFSKTKHTAYCHYYEDEAPSKTYLSHPPLNSTPPQPNVIAPPLDGKVHFKTYA